MIEDATIRLKLGDRLPHPHGGDQHYGDNFKVSHQEGNVLDDIG